MPLSAGDQLDPYEMLAGEVYFAHDAKPKRDGALKVLPEAFARDPERIVRVQREGEVPVSPSHPNIAASYVAEDRALATEFVEGESSNGPMPLETALGYARQIADIWAFGVAQYETITGKRLLRGADLAGTIAAAVPEKPDLSDAPVQVWLAVLRNGEKEN